MSSANTPAAAAWSQTTPMGLGLTSQIGSRRELLLRFRCIGSTAGLADAIGGHCVTTTSICHSVARCRKRRRSAESVSVCRAIGVMAAADGLYCMRAGISLQLIGRFPYQRPARAVTRWRRIYYTYANHIDYSDRSVQVFSPYLAYWASELRRRMGLRQGSLSNIVYGTC